MIKTIKTIMRQDREPYRIPRRVQDVIPVQCVWADGIFRVGNNKFSKQIVREENIRGATVVLSCHDAAILEELADEIISIKHGKIVSALN